jgi:hypothetical protein
MPTSRSTSLAAALAAGSLLVPAAATAQQDLRSPDARDAAASVRVAQDLRSPDARDAARPSAPATLQVTAAPEPLRSAPTGFDWPSALVGAGTIALLALAGVAAVAGRRRRHGPVAA